MRKSPILAFTCAVLAFSPALAGPKEDALLRAVRIGDTASTARLLADKADANARLADGSTALAWAVDRQDPQIVRLLLAAGAKVDTADIDGTTPLILACQFGDASILTQLLDAKATVTAVRADGVTALEICAGRSTPDVLERMIAAGAAPDVPDAAGQTPLMWAIANGRLDNFAALLKHGADVNRASKAGFSALFFAIKSPEPKAVQAVLDAGGSRGQVAADGTTAVQLAAYQNRLDLAARFVADGANVQAFDRDGKTLLHIAVAADDEPLVKLLLSRGANPNVITGTSIIERRSEPNAGGFGDALKIPPTAPLLTAASRGSVSMMKLLLTNGADPAFALEDGTNLLLAAAGSRKLAALEYALQFPVDVNAVGNGNTALHAILGRGGGPDTVAMFKLLAAKGARMDIKNRRGRTVAELVEQAPDEVKLAYAEVLKARGDKPVAPVKLAAQPQ